MDAVVNLLAAGLFVVGVIGASLLAGFWLCVVANEPKGGSWLVDMPPASDAERQQAEADRNAGIVRTRR